uniref:MSP domain-containing protein n=1 Tax=Caenorhabditis tropicalis TaxID=1561998 RepID=A0A1I7UE67_9PELO
MYLILNRSRVPLIYLMTSPAANILIVNDVDMIKNTPMCQSNESTTFGITWQDGGGFRPPIELSSRLFGGAKGPQLYSTAK